LDALVYAESLRPDIILLTAGWTFAPKGVDVGHDAGGSDLTLVPSDDFVFARDAGRAIFQGPPWNDPVSGAPLSRSLYVVSAGSNFARVGSGAAERVPGTLLQTRLPGQTLVVGGASPEPGGLLLKAPISNYGDDLIYGPFGWALLDPFTETTSSFAGPSAASAVVAGTAGLTLAADRTPRGDPMVLRERLLTTARREVLGQDSRGETLFMNAPYIDSFAAVAP
jgi:hypothetical protein